MTQIARAKAIIDALAGQVVSGAKAETVVRRFMNNYTSTTEELAEAFNLFLLNHIRHKMRDNAGSAAEKEALLDVEQARSDGYSELDYTP